MDFKNLCHNIDVNSLKARIPSLPSMPAMPQIKLPKSLPKLRTRRIFSRSRDDLSRTPKSSVKEQQRQQQQQHQQPSQLIIPPPAEFINHSPHRISTISSLMNEQQQQRQQQQRDSQRGTYRSADSVDDDYLSTRDYQTSGRHSRPISPIHHTPMTYAEQERQGLETTIAKMTLSEKLQKGYKDFTEFRLSHIFAKKTVVRKDMIQVDHYVERFNEDREREQAEQERRDHKIADNYRFDFKLSRQDTDTSKRMSISSAESSPRHAQTERSRGILEQSEDESGMEASPPPRRPGIASTRFARVRNPPLELELNEDEEEDGRTQNVVQPRQQQKVVQSTPEKEKEPESRTARALHKLRSLSKRSEETPEKATEKKRRAPLTPQQSEEKEKADETADHDNRLSTLKQNIKRFSKSIKRGAHEHESRTATANANALTTNEDTTDGEGTPKQERKQISRTERFTARLRKYASREASTEQLDDEGGTPKKPNEPHSPIRAAISSKLQTWKKSFKRKSSEADAQTGDETSPEREKHTDNLMGKLRNMRQRKRASSTDELDAGTDDEATHTSKEANARKAVNFEERFQQARKRTLKKVNEKMQQMNFFHKSQEHIDKMDSGDAGAKKVAASADEEQSEDERTVYVRPTRSAARRTAATATPSDSEEDEAAHECEQQLQSAGCAYGIEDSIHTQHTRTLWTTKNLLTESLDSELDDNEFPRVLIHQDNSDQYESTLIIAVTRPAPAIPIPSPIIEEIHDEDKRIQKPPRSRSRTASPGGGAEWIPNNEIISNFLEITPPSKRRPSAEAILAPAIIVTSRSSGGGHTRKMSMDSNSDSDSWIADAARAKKLDSLGKKESSVDEADATARALTPLNSIDENEEPWKVHHTFGEEKLYKAKSIDIFEASIEKGGVTAAFDDFEEELRNEPVLRVPQQRHVDSSFEKDSSEEPFAADYDDDNSSRVTKISVSVIREEEYEDVLLENAAEHKDSMELPCKEKQEFYNSSESLLVHASDRSDKDGYEDEDEYEEDDDRPPSAAPSPPPSMSPPPPPLPLRKPALVVSKSIEISTPPPVARLPPPTARPPIPPPTIETKPQPPRIPDRTPTMSRISKPLVKTSSLRLAYDEQVKPSDVGKVNKLISRFETTQTNGQQPTSAIQHRPRIIRRRLTRDESEEYSDDEDDLDEESNSNSEHEVRDGRDARNDTERDVTPTPTNTPRTYSLESEPESVVRAKPLAHRSQVVNVSTSEEMNLKTNGNTTANGNQTKVSSDLPKITLNFDTNSNLSLSLSCTSSEYGSPLEYPSSLIGSTETTPMPERKSQAQPQQQPQSQDLVNARNAERNRRSMTRDDDKFLSFDSDDENSYYSISSTSSGRYVVEI